MFLFFVEHLVSIPWYFHQIWGGSKFVQICLNYRFNWRKTRHSRKGQLFAFKFAFLDVFEPILMMYILWLDSFFVAGWERKHPSNPSRAKKGWVIQSFVLDRILCLDLFKKIPKHV